MTRSSLRTWPRGAGGDDAALGHHDDVRPSGA